MIHVCSLVVEFDLSQRQENNLVPDGSDSLLRWTVVLREVGF